MQFIARLDFPCSFKCRHLFPKCFRDRIAKEINATEMDSTKWTPKVTSTTKFVLKNILAGAFFCHEILKYLRKCYKCFEIPI